MNIVRVGQLPGRVQEVALEDGAAVSDAIEHAGLSTSGYEVRRNGSTTSLNTTVEDGDTILLVRQIKGNQDVVRIGKVPGSVNSYALEHGSTVEDALSEAGLDASGYEVRRNGSTTSMTAEVSDGDTILLVRQIKGNVR